LVVGALLTVVPLAEPHMPFVELIPDELAEVVPDELDVAPEPELVELEVAPELDVVPLELDVVPDPLELDVELDDIPDPLDAVLPEELLLDEPLLELAGGVEMEL
jgi:hypothetical protein